MITLLAEAYLFFTLYKFYFGRQCKKRRPTEFWK